MAVSVLGTVEGTNSAAATNWQITSPSSFLEGDTTIYSATSYSTNAVGTPASGFAIDVDGQGGLTGWCHGTYLRSTSGFLSNKLVTNDTPSQALTFTQASDPSVSRHIAGVTFRGGVITGSCRIFNSFISPNTNATATGTTWRFGGCRPGDKLLFVIANYAGNSDMSVITTGSNVTLTNITKHAYYPGTTTSTPAISIWSADCGTTQSGVSPTIGVNNPAGASNTSCLIYVYAIRPHPPIDLGLGGSDMRIEIIGDSLTNGSAFAGALNGETPGESPERWCDLLFGNQATITATTLNYQSNATVIGTSVSPRTWYSGTYTPYDGSPTKPVRIRGKGQPGWDAVAHWGTGMQPRAVANDTDGGKGADICIISLGANDERNLRTTDSFRNDLFALAMASGSKYVVLVKQWAWAFDFVSPSTTFTRVDTHANYHAAIDAVASLLTAAGRTPIVVDVGADADVSGGTDVSVVTNSTSWIGLVGSSGGAVDNIHGNAASHAATWAPTIRTALDQIPELQAGGGGGGTGTPSIASLPSIPSIP